MRHPVKHGAEEDAVQEHLPVLSRREPEVLDEALHSRNLPGPLFRVLRRAEEARLGDEHLDGGHKSGEASTDEEDGLVADAGARDCHNVDDGRDEIPDRIALLQDARKQPARLDRHVLKRHGGRETPDAAHGDAEEGAHADEGGVRGHVGGADLQRGEDPEIDDHGPLAAEHVGGDADDGGAGGAEEQCQGDRERDGRQGLVVGGG